MNSKTIYLDNSATARPSEKALSQMHYYHSDAWGIPSAPHRKGQELLSIIKESYQTLYRLLGANEKDQVILTSSGTEAVNHVFFSAYCDITLTSGKNHFITANTDEAASIMSATRLERFGCVSKMIEVNEMGLITPELLAESLSPRTALFSLSWGNGLTGVIQPIHELAELCHQRGVLFHLDATHVLGKLDFDLADLKADFMTFNGEQIHGPKGSGGLYIREGLKISPFICGGMDQGGLRAGALNVPTLVGLAAAAEEAIESRDLLCTETARLRNQLEQGILKRLPTSQVCFHEQERLPHCTTLLFPGIVNEALLFSLNRQGICASIGGGNFQQLALILQACGLSEHLAHSAISFSLSRYTTDEEIDRTVDKVVDCVTSLSKLSTAIFTE